MKKVRIKEMTLRNFKGDRNITIEFNDSLMTSIIADNGKGKTTKVDAWLWLTSGKNSEGDKNFGIKTNDPEGNPIHRLEHEVSAKIEVNGNPTTLRKVYKEKWSKKRNSLEEEFTGHTTDYYIDDVPYKDGEYHAKLAALICNDETSKILSNVTHFNTMPWEKQRDILTKLAPKVTNDDVFTSLSTRISQNQIEALKSSITQDKDISLLKKEVANKVKLIKDEAKTIPSRMDEVQRSIVDESGLDQLKLDLSALDVEFKALEIQKGNVFNQQQEAQQQHLAKVKEVSEKRFELQKKYDSIIRNSGSIYDTKISDLGIEIKGLESKVRGLESDKSELNTTALAKETARNSAIQKLDEAKKNWEIINSNECNAHTSTSCPTCKRDYDAGKIEEQKSSAITTFNTDKFNKLTESSKVIDELKKEIEVAGSFDNSQEVNEKTRLIGVEQFTLEAKRKELEEVEAQKQNLEIPSEAIELKKQIDELKDPESPVLLPDESVTITNAINENNAKQSEIKEKLAIETTNKQAKARLEELNVQLQTLNSELDSWQGKEHAISQFESTYIGKIEDAVNSMFKYVKFRMFKTQVNGEKAQTCECMVNGVVYSDLNTAARINAGFDIVNTLSEKAQITLPVFIDNKESVTTVENIDTSCIGQIILLEKVSGADFKVI